MFRSSKFKQSFIASLLLHLTPILLLIFMHGGGGVPGKKGDKKGEAEMPGIHKNGEFKKPLAEKEVEITLITLPKKKDVDKNGLKKKRKEREKKVASRKGICGDNASYGGIGVTFSFGRKILEAPEWYPAYKYGLRVGDQILGSSEEILGTPGTSVDILVKRFLGGNIEMIHVTREKICYDDLGRTNGP